MLDEIICTLDSNENMKEFIDSRVQEVYDYYASYNLEDWEEIDYSIDIAKFFEGYKAVEALSVEEFELLKNAINKNIYDRAVAKKLAVSYSGEYAINPENIAFYNGSSSSAFEHSLEKELGSNQNSLSTSYSEIKGIQK